MRQELRDTHDGITLKVHLFGPPSELFPLVHRCFQETSFSQGYVAPAKYFSGGKTDFFLNTITPKEMKLADISLGQFAHLFKPDQIELAEELNHLLFKVMRGVVTLPPSYRETDDLAVGLTLEGNSQTIRKGLSQIQNTELVSQIKMFAHYKVGADHNVVSRLLPDLTEGRSQVATDELKLFSRYLDDCHRRLLQETIHDVALFFRKRIKKRQDIIVSLARQILRDEADEWLNEPGYYQRTRLQRLDSQYDFEKALTELSKLKTQTQPPAHRNLSLRAH